MIILSFFLVLLSCLSYLFCQAKEANKKIKKDPLRPHGQKGKNKMSNLVDEVNKEMADTIKRLPGNLLRLIRTIQQIEEWNERHKTNFYKDNFEEIKNKLLQTQKEYDDIYDKLYKSGDFEMLLPQTYEEMADGFIDSEYLDETFNDVSGYYTSGENGDWCVEQILDDYEPADDPSLDITENYNYIAQNDDFKTLCEFYYNKEYDIEEEGTFEDNYIDSKGNFDFEKFCETTDFKDDIMNDLTKKILKDDKVYQRMDEIRQSYKEDEQKYYNEKYEDYTNEELETEMDELRKAPIYANSGHVEEIQREIYRLNMDAMERTLEKAKNQISKPAPSFDDDWER